MLPARVLLYSPSLGGTEQFLLVKTARVQREEFSGLGQLHNLLYIEFHPFFQLVSYILSSPFCQVCNKNSRIK